MNITPTFIYRNLLAEREYVIGEIEELKACSFAAYQDACDTVDRITGNTSLLLRDTVLRGNGSHHDLYSNWTLATNFHEKYKELWEQRMELNDRIAKLTKIVKRKEIKAVRVEKQERIEDSLRFYADN
jgi:hypothetical protein